MNVPDVICGHDRQTLIVRLINATLKDSGEIAQDSDEWLEKLGARPQNSTCIAVDAAIQDPAKLAGIIAELLRAFGFVDDTTREFTSNEWRAHARAFDVFKPYRESRINVFVRHPNSSFPGPPDLFLTMPRARVVALRLLGLPQDASTADVLQSMEWM